MATTNSTTSVDQTLNAAQSAGGLTKIKPNDAVTTIDGWISKLDGVDGGKTIQEDLRSLKQELSGGSPDGAKVSKLLSSLGSATTKAGSSDPQLQKLGQALTQASSSLKAK